MWFYLGKDTCHQFPLLFAVKKKHYHAFCVWIEMFVLTINVEFKCYKQVNEQLFYFVAAFKMPWFLLDPLSTSWDSSNTLYLITVLSYNTVFAMHYVLGNCCCCNWKFCSSEVNIEYYLVHYLNGCKNYFRETKLTVYVSASNAKQIL